jgi:hypothetical protein
MIDIHVVQNEPLSRAVEYSGVSFFRLGRPEDPSRIGFAHALGFEYGKGEYKAFMPPGSKIDPSAIPAITAALENGNDVVIVAPTVDGHMRMKPKAVGSAPLMVLAYGLMVTTSYFTAKTRGYLLAKHSELEWKTKMLVQLALDPVILDIPGFDMHPDLGSTDTVQAMLPILNGRSRVVRVRDAEEKLGKTLIGTPQQHEAWRAKTPSHAR